MVSSGPGLLLRLGTGTQGIVHGDLAAGNLLQGDRLQTVGTGTPVVKPREMALLRQLIEIGVSRPLTVSDATTSRDADPTG